MIPGVPDNVLGQFTEGLTHAREWYEHLTGWAVNSIREDIHDVRNSLDAMDPRLERAWRRAAGKASGTGALDLDIAGPRQGFQWMIERASLSVAGAAPTSVGVWIFLSQNAPGMAAFKLEPDMGDVKSSPFDPPIYVPQAVPLIAAFRAAPANADIAVSLQVVETPYPE